MTTRIKIVWLCHLSNPEVRERLPIKVSLIEQIVRRLIHNPSKEDSDYAVWNTNGIKEFEKFTDEIELFIIAPFHYLRKEAVRFTIRGIHYFFYKDRPSYLIREFSKRVFKKNSLSFSSNRKNTIKEINRIKPDIVHLIGAENPNYGLAAIDLPQDIPLIVQLQTLLSDPKFKDNYFMKAGDYVFRQNVEKQLILRSDYIGTTATSFLPFVKQIKKDAKIVRICLALTEPALSKNNNTSFDFVYYASSIDKAADLAVEAFAIAHQKHPNITLDIVGGGSVQFLENLYHRIDELNLANAITFEGRLSTHEDVIRQIRKSRFAVLPLRIDLISGTIRESMANGLPVVTTITPFTPKLNEVRETVLLSETGNHAALAANMCKLIEDREYADLLSANSILATTERPTNLDYMMEWKDTYFHILDERKPKDCS